MLELALAAHAARRRRVGVQARGRDFDPAGGAQAIAAGFDALERSVDGRQGFGLAHIDGHRQIAFGLVLRPVSALHVVAVGRRLGAANLATALRPQLRDQIGAHLLQLRGKGVGNVQAHGEGS